MESLLLKETALCIERCNQDWKPYAKYGISFNEYSMKNHNRAVYECKEDTFKNVMKSYNEGKLGDVIKFLERKVILGISLWNEEDLTSKGLDNGVKGIRFTIVFTDFSKIL